MLPPAVVSTRAEAPVTVTALFALPTTSGPVVVETPLPVKTVLVAQFGVDADRLTSNGFGADNPIGSNDTPDGRAGNRRVEFLKK